MSKERARRRQAREREAAIVTAARASAAEKRERRVSRKHDLSSRLPRLRRPPGVLAARRRRQVGATMAILLVVNVLVWFVFPEWPARLMVIIVSVLAAPVLHTMLFRRR